MIPEAIENGFKNKDLEEYVPYAIYEYVLILVGHDLAQKYLDIMMSDLLTENGK